MSKLYSSCFVNRNIYKIFGTYSSAGAGRTGTYIAIDNLIEEFHENEKVEIFNAVMKMRKNRKDMIQSSVSLLIKCC